LVREKLVVVLDGAIAVDGDAIAAALRVCTPRLTSVTVVRRLLEPSAVAGGYGGTGPSTLLELWVSTTPGTELDGEATASLEDEFGWPPVRRVAETVHVEPSGAPERGVLAVGLLRRNPAMTRHEFGAHWNGVHAPMVIDAGPLFDGYVTNVATDDVDGWDGLVEQWYRDAEMFARHTSETRAHKPEIVADMERLLGGVALYETGDCDWPSTVNGGEA
jgi:hypothetical protein